MVVGGVYFLANCLTFAARFLIFHFLLFADRRVKVVDELAVVEGGEPPRRPGGSGPARQPATADPDGPAAAGTGELVAPRRPSQVNGGTAGLNGWHRPGRVNSGRSLAAARGGPPRVTGTGRPPLTGGPGGASAGVPPARPP